MGSSLDGTADAGGDANGELTLGATSSLSSSPSSSKQPRRCGWAPGCTCLVLSLDLRAAQVKVSITVPTWQVSRLFRGDHD